MTGLTDIYLIQCSQNGKQYVGQAKQVSLCGKKRRGYLVRWEEHKSSARNDGSCVIHHAIRRHGEKHFSIQKLVSIENNLANDYEKMFIEMYNTLVPAGYNVSLGGTNAGIVHTMETRLKTSKGRRPFSTLPMNIYHLKTPCSEGYTVNQYSQHRATFASRHKSMEEKLEEAKAFLAHMPHEKPRRELPRYVFKNKTGLLLYFKQTPQRPKVWKQFKDGTYEEQLAKVMKMLDGFRQDGYIK